MSLLKSSIEKTDRKSRCKWADTFYSQASKSRECYKIEMFGVQVKYI